MPPTLFYTMIVTDGPFAGLSFTVPTGITGPGIQIQLIRGDVKVFYHRIEINHPNAWLKVAVTG